MTFSVRDGEFDLAIVAGPRVTNWPSVGVRAMSTFCSEMGLKVGVFGSESLLARGTFQSGGSGGVVFIEDSQSRIHRLSARSVVRVVSTLTLPDPFLGWRSVGLLPMSTALKLEAETRVTWNSRTVILGTGNLAFRFGSTLLEKKKAEEVLCVEIYPGWEGKRFSGWEVEKRRFEILGGRVIEAKPVSLTQSSPLVWDLKIEEKDEVKNLEVSRVVAAGPFGEFPGIRESPPGSFLFELEQTSEARRKDNVAGWDLESERGYWLAGKIVRGLAMKLGKKGGKRLQSRMRMARRRLKSYRSHRQAPFTPGYDGKWLSEKDRQRIQSFSGIPKSLHKRKPVAAMECLEPISCNLCQEVCPEGAIQIVRYPLESAEFLIEEKCTSCGICLEKCPSQSITMIHEKKEETSDLTLVLSGSDGLEEKSSVTLLNRKGETLGSGRLATLEQKESGKTFATIEVPVHLAWEVRGIRPRRSEENELDDPTQMTPILREGEELVEIQLDGEKRIVRDGLSIATVLFETAQCRSEDVLLCPDGSCQLCHVNVDGQKKLACQTPVHRGMSIKRLFEMSNQNQSSSTGDQELLCPCEGVKTTEIVERIQNGNLQTPEAVLSVTKVGKGKCHGQLCMGAFKRLLMQHGINTTNWIDWRFPTSEWTLSTRS